MNVINNIRMLPKMASINPAGEGAGASLIVKVAAGVGVAVGVYGIYRIIKTGNEMAVGAFISPGDPATPPQPNPHVSFQILHSPTMRWSFGPSSRTRGRQVRVLTVPRWLERIRYRFR
jgi:hypothetical protein